VPCIDVSRLAAASRFASQHVRGERLPSVLLSDLRNVAGLDYLRDDAGRLEVGAVLAYSDIISYHIISYSINHRVRLY
jgi:hypothetical protein